MLQVGRPFEKLDGSPADLISSTKQFIEDSRLRLQRLLESKIYAEDEIPSFELEVTSIDSDGMSLEIALPYTTTNSDDLRCDVPGYDRDATELLLMALVNDKRVRNISQIRLRDSNLANKGLCTLVGERRGSPPTFEQDYQLGPLGQLSNHFVLIVYLSTYPLMNYRIMASVSVRHL